MTSVVERERNPVKPNIESSSRSVLKIQTKAYILYRKKSTVPRKNAVEIPEGGMVEYKE